MKALELFEGLLQNYYANNFQVDDNREYIQDYAEAYNVEVNDFLMGVMVVAFEAETRDLITSSNDRWRVYEQYLDVEL